MTTKQSKQLALGVSAFLAAWTAATGAVFAFNVLPVFPSAGGAAPGAQTDSWTMTVVGTPTETFS